MKTIRILVQGLFASLLLAAGFAQAAESLDLVSSHRSVTHQQASDGYGISGQSCHISGQSCHIAGQSCHISSQSCHISGQSCHLAND